MHYYLDGSFESWMTAIFEMFARKERALHVHRMPNVAQHLFEKPREIMAEAEKADRVWKGIQDKIGHHKSKMFLKIWFAEDDAVLTAATRVLIRLFEGYNVLDDFGNADVMDCFKTVKKVDREKHRMKAFIRFNQTESGQFFAAIEPDFNVLPLIATFFKNRYSDQDWLIFDLKRKYGLWYDKQKVQEVTYGMEEQGKEVVAAPALALSEKDERYQKLWQAYFQSTNIKERKNLKLHIQHVPKRYWKYLSEKKYSLSNL